MKVDIQHGPADHPRGQGAVEWLGERIQDVLSELCVPCPERWDEYMALICWIKRTRPDPTLPGNMVPFKILFDHKPRTSLDTLVSQMDDSEVTRGLENFIKQRRQVLREVRQVLEKRHENRIATRESQRKDRETIDRSNGAARRPGISEGSRKHSAPQWYRRKARAREVDRALDS